MPLERKREPGMSGDFLPSGPLEELLMRAFREPEYRPAFCRRMLASGLLVLGSTTPTGVSLRQWTVGGRKVIPVFTSAQRLEDFAGPGTEHLAIQGRRLFRMIPPGVSAFLNPRTPIGREFPPEEIAALLANFPEEPDEGEGEDGGDDSPSEPSQHQEGAA